MSIRWVGFSLPEKVFPGLSNGVFSSAAAAAAAAAPAVGDGWFGSSTSVHEYDANDDALLLLSMWAVVVGMVVKVSVVVVIVGREGRAPLIL